MVHCNIDGSVHISNKAKDLNEYHLVPIQNISGADSIYEVELLILLLHDAMSAAENEAAPITHKP